MIDASAYADVDLDAPFLPAHVTGALFSATETGQRELAVAINGVIRTTTRTHWAKTDPPRFSAMVSPNAFRAGENAVEIFVIRDRAGGIALEPTERRPDISYFGVVGADGNVGAIASSDGRVFPFVSRSIVGQVTHSGAYFEGEAIDARRDVAAESLLLFGGGEFLHVQRLAPMQRDAPSAGHAASHASGELSTIAPRYRRFHFAIPYGRLGGDTSAHVQFIGVGRDAASRIDYRGAEPGSVDPRTIEPAWLGPTGTLVLSDRDGRDGLAAGGSWVPIDRSGTRGGVEAVEGGILSGWVTQAPRTPAAVLVFVDRQFAATGPIDPARSRFEMQLSDRDPSSIRFIVISADGSPVDLAYSPSQ